MKNPVIKCYVCQNADGGSCCSVKHYIHDNSPVNIYDCDICGRYAIQNTFELFIVEKLNKQSNRAFLSHILCKASHEKQLPIITPEWLNDFLKSENTLPNPIVQTANMIRYIGDTVSQSGNAIEQLPLNFHAIIGALNRESAIRLVKELIERRLLTTDGLGTAVRVDSTGRPHQEFTNISLTLDGWEKYEAEKRGQFSGNYGFIAMQFNDDNLDAFVRDVVKPAVKDGIGYELVDMRDVPEAGIIDNIMRIQIRDAAFVIADLTHDNNGAYWEAGYAEGLGKPVIYICEKTKFDNEKSHFDTNHCTTVPWSIDNDEGFKKELIATIRRSLDLFATDDSETTSSPMITH